MKIQVIGSGCPTCEKLYQIVSDIARNLPSDTRVEYITGQEGMRKILELGIMSSPVLTVNGKVVMIGFIPDTEIIKSKIMAV